MNETTTKIREWLKNNRGQIAMTLIIVYTLVLIYAWASFLVLQRHPPANALVISSASYTTTTLGVIAAILIV
jgi:hypothetical protein